MFKHATQASTSVDRPSLGTRRVNSPRRSALAAEKDIINKWMTTDLETAMEYSIRVVESVWSTKDMEEGVSAFVQKRKPKFEGR